MATLGIFRPVCSSCGEETAFSDALCPLCVAALEEAKHRCASCGYILSVSAESCAHCNSKASGIDSYYSDYLYTGALRKLIKEIKFNWRFRGASQLGRLVQAQRVDFGSYDYVVPVPYHALRRLARYRQPVDIIMKALEEHRGIKGRKVLVRVRNTEYQAMLTRKERLENIRGAFRLKTNIKGMKILIVDDILTTGATLSACAKLLKKKGALRVDVYTLMAGAGK